MVGGKDFTLTGTPLLRYVYEPGHEKTCLRDVQPGPTQKGLYCHRR